MGRNRHRKTTVEEARILSIYDLNRHGAFNRFVGQPKVLRWLGPDDEVRASIGYRIIGELEALELKYNITHIWDEPQTKPVCQRISLSPLPCHFGGVRYFFHCNLSVNGRYCGRRVAKLYLPSGGTYFGCRHCYSLSYESRQKYRGPFYWGVTKLFDLMEQDEPDWNRLTEKQRKKLERVYEKVNQHSDFLISLSRGTTNNSKRGKA